MTTKTTTDAELNAGCGKLLLLLPLPTFPPASPSLSRIMSSNTSNASLAVCFLSSSLWSMLHDDNLFTSANTTRHNAIRAHQSSLAPRAGANYIQGGHADASCTAWLRATLLGVVIHMCRRHAAPTQAQVRLHWTTWRSDLSSVNCRRSCLSCCWSKGVEWPGKRCYVGLVAVGVQEQAEDILVPPLLRNCLMLMTFPFLVIISLSPEQWSLQ